MNPTWRSTRPVAGEFLEYYGKYIDRVPEGDIVQTLRAQIAETGPFLRALPASLADHRYGPDKWSIREVIGHLADAERVFAYRALRFSRGDVTPVPGFDENSYVANSTFGSRSMESLIAEFEHIRNASALLFEGLDEAATARRGSANGAEITVRALAFVIAGHETHHMEILRTRYL